jgi:hypothetical protein
MTEEEWFACGDPAALLDASVNLLTDRQLRLFCCACCRHFIGDAKGIYNDLIEVAEAFADGKVGVQKLHEATEVARQLRFSPALATAVLWTLADVGWFEDRVSAWHDILDFVTNSACLASWENAIISKELLDKERAYQVSLVHDIVGNPFRPVVIETNWLRSHDELVPKLARSIYEMRSFTDLPLLADALEEVGCDNNDVLAHCRAGGEHVRGCWVLDLLRNA